MFKTDESRARFQHLLTIHNAVGLYIDMNGKLYADGGNVRHELPDPPEVILAASASEVATAEAELAVAEAAAKAANKPAPERVSFLARALAFVKG